MQFGRAFTYMFQDDGWPGKLAPAALLIILCAVPIIGLMALCGLLGWLTEIAHNVSHGRPPPSWSHPHQKFQKGLPVLLAVLVYHSPPLILLGLLHILNPPLAASLFGGIAFVGIVAVCLPLLFIYTAVAWSMLAIGLMRYGESGDRGAFYRFGKLLRGLQTNIDLTWQWLLYAFAANILLFILTPFALLGLILYFPAHGYLIGSYGRMLRAAEYAHRQGLR